MLLNNNRFKLSINFLVCSWLFYKIDKKVDSKGRAAAVDYRGAGEVRGGAVEGAGGQEDGGILE